MADPGVSIYRPRWWYLLSAGVATLLVSLLLNLVLRGPVLSIVGVPFVVAFVLWQATSLHVSAAGIAPQAVAKRRGVAPWDTVHRQDGWYGVSLRTAKTNDRTRPRINVWLSIYDRQWRTGRLGADLRRWAPELPIDPPAA